MTRTERRERQRRRKLQTARRVVSALLALVLILVCILLLTGGGKADTPELETAATPEPQMSEPETVDPLEADKIALAKMVWGEARGCSTTEQAAVVWCVLNRFDSGDLYYAGCDTIREVVTQESQFSGYDPAHPVTADILALVEDVLTRWMAEKVCVGDVGRVLPAEYLFFTGDGRENTFTTEWRGGRTWDWSLESPYEE
ncbi:MAG: hypothetical protein ACLVGP_10510 [Oscillospiraceae bacterium]